MNETLRFLQGPAASANATSPASAGATLHDSRGSLHQSYSLVQEPQPEVGLDCLRRIYDATVLHSSFVDRVDEYPRFHLGELALGRVLGTGGFGTVSEVLGITCADGGTGTQAAISGPEEDLSMRSCATGTGAFGDRDDSEFDRGGALVRMESRRFIARHCVRKGREARYALKQLSRETLRNPSKREQGIMDMAIETRMLATVNQHPNIVKMRAIATADMFSEHYFIVMDRLYDTLEKRIKEWEARSRRLRGIAGRLTDPKGRKAGQLYEERIHAAYDLAAAIEYLHEKGIVYRDIKPENAAFDIRGDIKIFDFGLAKELKDHLASDDGTYNLTVMTGTPRYMAPEVANGDGYNNSCDVYSFCIMLWQILALKLPYKSYGLRDLFDRVYTGPCERPLMKADWHTTIKLMLKRGWSQDPRERNTMHQIGTILRNELIIVRNGDATGLTHHKRRSTFVFRGLADSLRSLGRNHRQLGTIDSVRVYNDEDMDSERVTSSRGTGSQLDALSESAKSLRVRDRSLADSSGHRSVNLSVESNPAGSGGDSGHMSTCHSLEALTAETTATAESGHKHVSFSDLGHNNGVEPSMCEAERAPAVVAGSVS